MLITDSFFLSVGGVVGINQGLVASLYHADVRTR